MDYIDMDTIDKICLYTGCSPETINDDPKGRLLRVVERQKDGSFISRENSGSGICGFCRMINNNGETVFDGTVGCAAADVVFATGLDILDGGIITLYTGDINER